MKTPTTPQTSAGRGWAYLAAILGGAVSIAANVKHVYLVEADPDALAVAVSVFWPVALFVCVEMLARVQFPTGRLRHVRWGVAPVAIVAGIVSYRHLSGLLTHYGEDAVTAALGPLGVDGLMLFATGVMIATRRTVAEVAPVVAQLAQAAPVAAPLPAPVAPPTPVAAPRPRPVLVPQGVSLLPLVPVEAVEQVETAEGDADVLDLPLGRPSTAEETRRRFDALAERYAREGRRLTQTKACELLGNLPRRTLRDHLAATQLATSAA